MANNTTEVSNCPNCGGNPPMKLSSFYCETCRKYYLLRIPLQTYDNAEEKKKSNKKLTWIILITVITLAVVLKTVFNMSDNMIKLAISGGALLFFLLNFIKQRFSKKQSSDEEIIEISKDEYLTNIASSLSEVSSASKVYSMLVLFLLVFDPLALYTFYYFEPELFLKNIYVFSVVGIQPFVVALFFAFYIIFGLLPKKRSLKKTLDDNNYVPRPQVQDLESRNSHVGLGREGNEVSKNLKIKKEHNRVVVNRAKTPEVMNATGTTQQKKSSGGNDLRLKLVIFSVLLLSLVGVASVWTKVMPSINSVIASVTGGTDKSLDSNVAIKDTVIVNKYDSAQVKRNAEKDKFIAAHNRWIDKKRKLSKPKPEPVAKIEIPKTIEGQKQFVIDQIDALTWNARRYQMMVNQIFAGLNPQVFKDANFIKQVYRAAFKKRMSPVKYISRNLNVLLDFSDENILKVYIYYLTTLESYQTRDFLPESLTKNAKFIKLLNDIAPITAKKLGLVVDLGTIAKDGKDYKRYMQMNITSLKSRCKKRSLRGQDKIMPDVFRDESLQRTILANCPGFIKKLGDQHLFSYEVLKEFFSRTHNAKSYFPYSRWKEKNIKRAIKYSKKLGKKQFLANNKEFVLEKLSNVRCCGTTVGYDTKDALNVASPEIFKDYDFIPKLYTAFKRAFFSYYEIINNELRMHISFSDPKVRAMYDRIYGQVPSSRRDKLLPPELREDKAFYDSLIKKYTRR